MAVSAQTPGASSRLKSLGKPLHRTEKLTFDNSLVVGERQGDTAPKARDLPVESSRLGKIHR